MKKLNRRCCFMSDHHHESRRRFLIDTKCRIMLACVVLVIVGICTASDLRSRLLAELDQSLNRQLVDANARAERWKKVSLEEQSLCKAISELGSLRQRTPLSSGLATVCNTVPGDLAVDEMLIQTNGQAEKPLSVALTATPEHRIQQAQLANALALVGNVSNIKVAKENKDDPANHRIVIKFQTGPRQ